ncbi:MAG: M28 family peptidase [Chryseolinea sp.]
MCAQTADVIGYADKIVATDLREYLTIVASDAMEGRETGKRGQKMAAAFITAHFHDLGLTPPVAGDYLQHLDLYTSVSGDTYVVLQGKKHKNYSDVVFYGTETSNGEVSLPIVYVANGAEVIYSDVDVKGKAVLIFLDSPWLAGNKEVALARQKGATMVFVCNSKTKQEFERISSQVKTVTERSGLSLAKPSISEFQRPGLFIVSPTMAEAIMGTPIDKLRKLAVDEPNLKAIRKIKAARLSYKCSTEIKTVGTENVLGFLEGTDKKDEVLLITAHYDHIGVKPSGTGDLINNGADDDGSGTVSVMELAKVFAEAKRDGHGPRRSILFMLVTGEEYGLLGSEFYSENPIFPLEKTVVDLNIDMIGRRDPKHKSGPAYVYVIGADKLSTELNKISEAMNSTYTKLEFDYTYNDPSHPDRLYYRSDHWNFAKRNIPIIFYFDGIHEDYHKPSDEVSKIDFDLMAKRAQAVFYTAWEIANRENRIMPDVK